MFLERFQGQWLNHHLPGQPVLELDHSFGEEIFPKVQSETSPVQLEAIPSSPIRLQLHFNQGIAQMCPLKALYCRLPGYLHLKWFHRIRDMLRLEKTCKSNCPQNERTSTEMLFYIWGILLSVGDALQIPQIKYPYSEKQEKIKLKCVYNFVALEFHKGIFTCVFPETVISTIQLLS